MAEARRFPVLLLLSFGFLQLTLNWYDISAAFPQLGRTMGLGVPQLTLLISLFIAGYGVLHIPTGFLAAHFGIRRVALAGILLESLGAAASALAPSYPVLLLARAVAGLGGSLFVGCGFALVVAWFRGREIAFAQGVSGGVAFVVGAALGVFPWVGVIAALGWRGALLVGAGVGLLVYLASLLWLDTPPRESRLLAAGNLDWSSVGRVLGSRNLLLYGASVVGIGGSYFVASQLMATYAVARFHLPPGTAALLDGAIVLAGIPGAILGGLASDRGRTLRPYILVPPVVGGLALLAVPLAGPGLLWLLAVVVGGSLMFFLPAFTALPGHLAKEVAPPDVATAEGLLLTMLAVGGVIVPEGFGAFVAAHGFAAGWIFLGAVSVLFPLAGLFAEEPRLGLSAGAVVADEAVPEG